MTHQPSESDSTAWQSPHIAAAWQRQAAMREDIMGQTTRRMLEAADIKPGSRVLDIAAGSGEQSLAAARIAGTNGFVLATDISESMLNAAAESAKQEGMTNISTQVMDAEQMDLESESFDAVICQHGLMFVARLDLALSGIYKALRKGGRFAAVVWSSPEQNLAFSVPMSILLRTVGRSSTLLESAGIFSLGRPKKLIPLFQTAGFQEVQVQPIPRVYRALNAKTFLEERIAMGSGGMVNLLNQLSEKQRKAALDEILESLKPFEGPNGFAAPCESLLVYGNK
ncbi:ubiquinone/menaquinone biosynthesis C-methylase UbiE [Paenibacillus rhizosphaerae]|uniref:Ubiquinone/menaquinone biosynthesis C-methylase UbiE n=1 Tax=Paenibacillus rhizosphaerae TaxID=297318 RepID=A0A839TTF7_9BACL|nr:methyltransferase domain-containing protein [Paenibacillus rhizosphaerae]MBB3128688.1 ubiquinone/menaquinone biosynthesis C-methylase UbiE [Paenibacillus rhizosphaerae]